MRSGRHAVAALTFFVALLTVATSCTSPTDDQVAQNPPGGSASQTPTLDSEVARRNGNRPTSLLVFTKTSGYRHDSIAAGTEAISEFAQGSGLGITVTESTDPFTDEGLAGFGAIVFLSTTGDLLDEAQESALVRFIRGGGGFVGIHAAADAEYGWPWYGQLVGARFANHPPGLHQATATVRNREHPSTRALPERWPRTDEWYNFEENPRGRVNVLVTLDETTYQGGTMGDHPIGWCQNFEGGRSFYTGGGHSSEAFSEPLFREHLFGGIRWSLGLAAGDRGVSRSR